MRPIKFRGKYRWNGVWYYGSLFVNEKYGRTKIREHPLSYFDIDPETVGQFSGLYDCNGKEIYEGDILKWDKDGLLYVVKFWDGMFYASVEECNEGIFGGFPLHALTEHEDGKCEIVGNIYDNPELLKGGENE